MDKDEPIFDPGGRERLIEPELLAMQRVARELERERDAALAREAVLREALDGLLPAPGADPKWVNAALGILAIPSPAAEALLELALAAERFHGADMALAKVDNLEVARRVEWAARAELSLATEKWLRARKEGQGAI